ncbi:hypothetical protein N7539_001335 [Penicillium diatomitis]|uniref:Uncharacterized protein n=1 Tax=Penicillium diatomitis TaxID=2819901 RepID=A0A9W9XHR0_9EURO|nr:uncharacterized protein N7539_001335 [Penicillium diatomitis]KAJ5492589.1 hypothetical protein N7539_001335 [Penicillium diatomitis]
MQRRGSDAGPPDYSYSGPQSPSGGAGAGAGAGAHVPVAASTTTRSLRCSSNDGTALPGPPAVTGHGRLRAKE